MKNLTLKTLALLIATVMLILPVPVFAEEGVTYEIGGSLQANIEELIYTAEYEACSLEYTVYTFKPADVGKYTISSNKSMGIISYNGMWATTQPTDSTVNQTTLVWDCKSVGQSIWVAVHTQGVKVKISVEYEPIEIVTIPVVHYENKIKPEAFAFDGNSADLINVNVSDEVEDIPVLGPDGYYRLNDTHGPRIFVDLNDEQISLAAALDYGQLKIAIFNSEGKVENYLNYCNAFSEYLECIDSATGLYPLTDDLIEIYQKLGDYKGWYGEGGFLSLTSADAWMFACYYIESDIYEDGTETVWPETDTSKLETLNKINFTANGSDTIAHTANKEHKSVYSFTTWKKGTYTVSLEGTGTKEVWIVNSAGEIVASTDAAVTKTVSFDIAANAKETYYIVTRSSHTANSTLTVSVNYFSGTKGDVNGDGRLNTRDTIAFKKYYANASTKNDVSLKGLDYDGNGRVNTQDLLKMKRALNPSTGG
jgi:hypothetical protein